MAAHIDEVTRGLGRLDGARDDLLAILNRIPGFSGYSAQFVTALEATVSDAASKAASKVVIRGVLINSAIFVLGFVLGRRH